MNWQEFHKRFKAWNERSLKDSLCPTYVFNKWVFLVCFFVCVAFALVIMNNHDWNFNEEFYYHCPEDAGSCVNPYVYPDGKTHYGTVYAYPHAPCPVDDEYFCNTPTFMPGYTYGEKMPEDVKSFPGVVFGVFLAGFVLNHFLYNNKRGAKVK